MARVTASPTRLKVYRLLVDGAGPNSGLVPSRVAEELGISKAAEARHRAALEAGGFISRIPGMICPVLYKRGPRSNIMDKVLVDPTFNASVNLDGGTVPVNLGGVKPPERQKGREIYVPTARAHINGRVIFPVLKVGDLGPLRIRGAGEDLELRIFEAKPYLNNNGVEMIKGKVPYNGQKVTVQYLESPNVRELSVWPPEAELVVDQFDTAREIFEQLAAEVARFLERWGGWRFGPPEFKGAVELASTEERILANIPADMRGSPSSPLWVDTSLGPREIETKDPDAAKAVFDFPGVSKDLDGRLRLLEGRSGRILVVLERLELGHEKLANIAAALAERGAHEAADKVEKAESDRWEGYIW